MDKNRHNQKQHLYWRAGFGLSITDWKKKEDLSIQECVKELFDEASKASQSAAKVKPEVGHRRRGKNLSKAKKKKLRKQQEESLKLQNLHWLEHMANAKSSPLLEKMSLFWHGHFACIFKYGNQAVNQINTIRTHALGNFKALLLAIAKDPAMIKFLNNQQNKKRSPNENFAREVLELFTIGRGNYTEKDIKEAARAFTGWQIDINGEFHFNERQHDFGDKEFMGKKGKFNGEDIIDIILEQKATAHFICRKIYQYFVNEKIDKKQLEKLADSFYDSSYDIQKLMRSIFDSRWFYKKTNRAVKIKSPIELIVGIMRSLQVEFKEPPSVLFIQKALGQILFKPPNVAGWAGGKNWIDNSTLMLRLNMATYLLLATNVDFKVKEEFEAAMRNKRMEKINASINLKPLIRHFHKTKEDQLFEDVANYLLQIDVAKIKHQVMPFTDIGQTKEDRIKLMTMWLMSLPEYQLC